MNKSELDKIIEEQVEHIVNDDKDDMLLQETCRQIVEAGDRYMSTEDVQ